MLSLFVYLVWSCCSAAQADFVDTVTKHLVIESQRCDVVEMGKKVQDVYRVTFDKALNKDWLQMTLLVLTTNRTHLDKSAIAPIHKIHFGYNNFPSKWGVRLETDVVVDNDVVTFVHLSRDETETEEAVFDIIVEMVPDATGCYNVSGEGTMTRVQYFSSDAYLLRNIGSIYAFCTHVQPPQCVEYYKPLKRERDICKLCYLAFVVMAFVLIHLIGSV